MCAPVLLPAQAQAAPLTVLAPAEQAPDDPEIVEARALYKDGEIKFQTADYEDALALWKKAYGMLPDGEDTRGMRHALVYNIAEAHSRAYEVSRNQTHLRKAKILLETYRSQHRELYGDETEAVAERTEVDDRIAELDKLIAESEAAGEVAAPISEPEEGEPDDAVAPPPEKPQPQPRILTPRQQWDKDIRVDPKLGPQWAQSQKRLVGGSILTGIGSIFLLIAVPAFVLAPQERVFPGLYWGAGAFTGASPLAPLSLD